MRRESKANIARKYIIENRDRMERAEIIKNIMEITNLKKISIDHVFSELENPEKYTKEKLTGKEALQAKEYIRDNINNLSSSEIIDYLTKNTTLSVISIVVLINRERDRKITPKIIKKEYEEEILYKGRRRNFFRFDDSNLYRCL